MEEKKSLYDISWKVDEPTYRKDEALSYSTLARFKREGFNKLDSLFEQISSPSLTFGSAVDALITGGQKEFDANFIVAEFPAIKPNIIDMVKRLYTLWGSTYLELKDIPNQNIILLSENEGVKFQLNWKPETRARVVKENGAEYYALLRSSGTKTVLNTEDKIAIDNAVRALKESPATKFYFQDNNPFDTRYDRQYQLKFKATLDGVDYRCMADLLIVDYEKKVIYPIDLKTSSHTEWDFWQSFLDWDYQIQARLYWRIIRDNLDRDDFFKEFELADYKFIVVNKQTLTPLVWEFPDTKKLGTLEYRHSGAIISLIDPFKLGKTLSHYLKDKPKVPDNINITEPNNIVEWLNKE